MSKSNTLTLEYPVKLASGDLKTVVMRRPTVGDHIAVEKLGVGELEGEEILFARMCSMNPEDLHGMDMADYKGLQEIYKGFLSKKKTD